MFNEDELKTIRKLIAEYCNVSDGSYCGSCVMSYLNTKPRFNSYHWGQQYCSQNKAEEMLSDYEK